MRWHWFHITFLAQRWRFKVKVKNVLLHGKKIVTLSLEISETRRLKQLLLTLSLSLWLWLRPVSYHDSVSQVTTNEPTEQRQRSAAEGRGEEGGEGKGGEGRDKEAGREARYGSWLQTRSRWSWLWSLARSVGRSLSSVERWFLSENAGLTG